jgi:hypothetical protein
MSGGPVFFVGVGGVIAYVIYSVSSYDPQVFKMTADQAQAAIASKVLHLPRKDGDGRIEIKGISSSKGYTTMSLQYDVTAPIIPCKAVVTPVSATEVKVKADCTDEYSGKSAMQDTVVAYHGAMFDEFIQSTLRKRDFDRATVDSKEMAITMKNMRGMQHEALKASDEMQAFQAQNK